MASATIELWGVPSPPARTHGFGQASVEHLPRLQGQLPAGPETPHELTPDQATNRPAEQRRALPKAVANSNDRASGDYVAGAMEAALPLTPERLELIKACAGSRSPHADAVAASRIAQRFAPRPPALPSGADPHAAAQAPLTAPFFALAAGIRRLTAVLVVAALLPNLTLAAFWLRAIDMPWSKQSASGGSWRAGLGSGRASAAGSFRAEHAPRFGRRACQLPDCPRRHRCRAAKQRDRHQRPAARKQAVHRGSPRRHGLGA